MLTSIGNAYFGQISHGAKETALRYLQETKNMDYFGTICSALKLNVEMDFDSKLAQIRSKIRLVHTIVIFNPVYT